MLAAPIRDALGDLPAVDLAVAYGLRASDDAPELAVAAVTLRPDHELNAEMLSHALREVPEGHRPAVVHVIDEIPVTTWFRPLTGPLRQAGLPAARRGPGLVPGPRRAALPAAHRSGAQAAVRRVGEGPARRLRRAATRPSRA